MPNVLRAEDYAHPFGDTRLSFGSNGSVRGDSPAGQRTVALFALAGWDAWPDDPRRQGRVRAWRWAETTDDETLYKHPERLGALIAATGFLMTWLAARRQIGEMLGAMRELVPGFYPGTDWERIGQR